MPEPDEIEHADPSAREEALLTRVARRQGLWPAQGRLDKGTEAQPLHTWSRGESDGLHTVAFGTTIPWPPGKEEPSPDSSITRSRGED